MAHSDRLLSAMSAAFLGFLFGMVAGMYLGMYLYPRDSGMAMVVTLLGITVGATPGYVWYRILKLIEPLRFDDP